jgi:hypothetical protein
LGLKIGKMQRNLGSPPAYQTFHCEHTMPEDGGACLARTLCLISARPSCKCCMRARTCARKTFPVGEKLDF